MSSRVPRWTRGRVSTSEATMSGVEGNACRKRLITAGMSSAWPLLHSNAANGPRPPDTNRSISMSRSRQRLNSCCLEE
jgi:hypothetical protein